MHPTLRRFFGYLILWAVLFLILCIVSVAIHWGELTMYMSSVFSAWLSTLITAGIVIGGIVMLFRSLFR